MTKPKRQTVATAPMPMGMWAVMRHRTKMTNAKFVALHESIESAISEAERLTTETITKHGPNENFCFYVVQVVGRMGIIGGKLTRELE